jgi:hypothetical protein
MRQVCQKTLGKRSHPKLGRVPPNGAWQRYVLRMQEPSCAQFCVVPFSASMIVHAPRSVIMACNYGSFVHHNTSERERGRHDLACSSRSAARYSPWLTRWTTRMYIPRFVTIARRNVKALGSFAAAA